MSIMVSQILKFVDLSKTQKLNIKILFFLQIKKSFIVDLRVHDMVKNSFIMEVTFKTFVLTAKCLVSISDWRIFTINRSIKSKRDQDIFVGILLIQQFLADLETSYFLVRSDNEIF